VTLPAPLRLAADAIVIQPTLLFAVHSQPLNAVTLTMSLAADAPNERAVGDSVNVHAAPACVSVNTLSSTVMCATRESTVVFAETEYLSVALPVALPPLVIVSQLASLEAAQLHPVPAVTPRLPVVLAAVMDREVAERFTVQGVAPACVSV
jgi:hypothetical protein